MDISRIEEHLAQWKHNRAFLQEISLRYPDWIVTVALYVTIHAVEALLTADGAKSRSRHQDRLQILACEKRYERIHRSFRHLYDLAHVTRYSAKPAEWVPPDKIAGFVIKQLLYPIEQSVTKLLSVGKPTLVMPDLPAIDLKPA